MITRTELEDFRYDLLDVLEKAQALNKRYEDLVEYQLENDIDIPAIESDAMVFDRFTEDLSYAATKIDDILSDTKTYP